MENTLEANLRFLSEKADSVWWFNGEFVAIKNETVIKLIRLLKDNPSMTIQEMAMLLSINPSAVQKHLKALQDKAYIERTGTNKNVRRNILLVSTT